MTGLDQPDKSPFQKAQHQTKHPCSLPPSQKKTGTFSLVVEGAGSGLALKRYRSPVSGNLNDRTNNTSMAVHIFVVHLQSLTVKSIRLAHRASRLADAVIFHVHFE